MGGSSKKLSKKTFAERTAKPSQPDMQDLKIVWQMYRELDGKPGGLTIVHLAELQKLSVDTVHRALKRVEAWTGQQKLIDRTPGQGATIAEGSQKVMARIADLCDRYHEIINVGNLRTIISVDSGITMFIEPLVGVFKEFQKENPEVDFDLNYDQPAVLRERQLKGLADISILAVHEDLQKGGKVAFIEYPMAIIAVHGHPFIEACKTNRKIPWHLLEGETVALLSERSPYPPYPPQVMQNPAIHTVRYDSYAILHAMVAAGGCVTFSLPQFLTAEQHEQLDVFPYPQAGKVRLGLIYSENSRMPRTPSEKAQIQKLVALIEKHLQKLAVPSVPIDMPAEFDAYFVVSGDNGRSGWVKGILSCRVQPSGRFGGKLKLAENCILPDSNLEPSDLSEEVREYDIRGFVEVNEEVQQVCVMFEGKLSQQVKDVFSASYVVGSPADMQKRFVGNWHGHQIWKGNNTRTLIPSVGFSVLMPKQNTELVSSELNAIVREYQKGLTRKLELELPEPRTRMVKRGS